MSVFDHVHFAPHFQDRITIDRVYEVEDKKSGMKSFRVSFTGSLGQCVVIVSPAALPLLAPGKVGIAAFEGVPSADFKVFNNGSSQKFTTLALSRLLFFEEDESFDKYAGLFSKSGSPLTK